LLDLLLLGCLVGLELADRLLGLGKQTRALCFLFFVLKDQLLVLGLKLFHAVFYTLYVQLQLLLYAYVLAYISLKILNQLLIQLWAGRHRVGVNGAAAISRLVFFAPFRLNPLNFLSSWSPW